MTTLAIQGESGSFSHEAALFLYPDAGILPCAHSDSAFRAVLSGTADAAVIPIENTLAGSVLEHYDLLMQHPVVIVREMLLRIEHNLIGLPGSRLSEVRRVLSHPVALAQCRRFFEAHRSIMSVPAYDTAGSVKLIVSDGESNVAAIAPARAAGEYGGEILLRNIEDDPQNFTRFLEVRASPAPVPADADKSSLAFTLPNRPGALVAALQVLAEAGANLSHLESRPVRGQPWHYIFYADYCFEDSSTAERILEALTRVCPTIKELGRFRAAPSAGAA